MCIARKFNAEWCKKTRQLGVLSFFKQALVSKNKTVRWKGIYVMNMISCNTDCIYQKDGFCNLNFIPEISSTAVCGCHYYKKEEKADLTQENNGKAESGNI